MWKTGDEAEEEEDEGLDLEGVGGALPVVMGRTGVRCERRELIFLATTHFPWPFEDGGIYSCFFSFKRKKKIG